MWGSYGGCRGCDEKQARIDQLERDLREARYTLDDKEAECRRLNDRIDDLYQTIDRLRRILAETSVSDV